MFDNRFALQCGGVHFLLPIGGKRIAYAYIRKNGCSAFKGAAGLPPTAHVGEMMPLKWNLLDRADAKIFVWRDPVERLVSLYRNKIVDGESNGDFLRTYREKMGEEPSTFERFVEFAITEADPHCIRQRSHLKPIRYTHAIPLNRLHEAMTEIVGEEAAEPFRRPVNTSEPTPVEVSDRALEMIRKHYHADFSMIERIRGGKRAMHTLGEDPEVRAAGWPHFTVIDPKGAVIFTGRISECERRLKHLNDAQVPPGPCWNR